MYNGLPIKHQRRLLEYFRREQHWITLVLYDGSITALVLSKTDRDNEIHISAAKQTAAKGVKAGRIVNSRKASRTMGYLLKMVCDETGIKDNRVLMGLDTPPLLLTPKDYADDSCLKLPCNETNYRRILNNIYRENSYAGQHIIEIIPLNIRMGGRLVEDPYGISGQMKMHNCLVSLSDQDREDFERCLRMTGYHCVGFFSGFHNLCSTFSEIATEEEHVLLIDLKHNSTDVIMFRGDQPIAVESYMQGLDKIILESLSSVLRIDRMDAIACLEKYYKNGHDKNTEIIEKSKLPLCSMGLKHWEMHEIIMGQLKGFIDMADGIGSLVLRLAGELHAPPRRLILTGEGARIPEIRDLFEKSIRVRTETKERMSPSADVNMQTTAYGMALTIARDSGASIQH